MTCGIPNASFRYDCSFDTQIADAICSDCEIFRDVSIDRSDTSHVGKYTGQITDDIATEGACYNVAKNVYLSTDRDIASHKTCVTDISDDNICVVTDHVATDVTDHVATDVTDHVATDVTDHIS